MISFFAVLLVTELTSDEYVYMINTGPEVPFNGVNVGTTTRHTSQVTFEHLQLFLLVLFLLG